MYIHTYNKYYRHRCFQSGAGNRWRRPVPTDWPSSRKASTAASSSSFCFLEISKTSGCETV